MSYIALDVGSKTVGVAISDAGNFLASPLCTLRFESEDYDRALDLIEELIQKHQLEGIIIGFPKHMNGSVGESGLRSMFFKEEIEKFTDLPVVLWDERLTTVSANRVLQSSTVKKKDRRAVVDQLAAVHMLQEYLDFKRSQSNGK